jgi:hypothetical protein
MSPILLRFNYDSAFHKEKTALAFTSLTSGVTLRPAKRSSRKFATGGGTERNPGGPKVLRLDARYGRGELGMTCKLC